MIKFNPKDAQSYKIYTDVLDKYIDKYEDINHTRSCSGKESNSDIVKDGKVVNKEKEACRFILSPFRKADCLKENDYGFKTGQPCVIVSLNRLIGWKPEDYDRAEIPAEVASRYKPGNIAFNCHGMVSRL